VLEEHDLQRAIKEFEDECWDWTIIKAYYVNYPRLKRGLSIG
jgi:hypothetical protein